MAYSVDTYTGSKTFVVEDGTIDSSLDIRLIGKNYAGYGEAQNENFLHMLENFAGPTAPPRPINGQIWYDSILKKLKFYDSVTQGWRNAGGAEPSPIPPNGQASGDLWWDTVNYKLYSYTGTTWKLIGPSIAGGNLGDILYQSAAGETGLIPANNSTIKKFLTQTGNGTSSNTPQWTSVLSSLPIQKNDGSLINISVANGFFEITDRDGNSIQITIN